MDLDRRFLYRLVHQAPTHGEVRPDPLESAGRTAAERTAASMGHPLPDEATLRRLMDEGASRMHAQDDRVEPIPWEG